MGGSKVLTKKTARERGPGKRKKKSKQSVLNHTALVFNHLDEDGKLLSYNMSTLFNYILRFAECRRSAHKKHRMESEGSNRKDAFYLAYLYLFI